jgi:hypothetical protein
LVAPYVRSTRELANHSLSALETIEIGGSRELRRHLPAATEICTPRMSVNQVRHQALRSTTVWIRAVALASSAAALAALLASAGCTNATGNISGGDYILPTFDGGVAEAAPVQVADLVLPDGCSDGGANAGARWQDLYACYFGTSGVASCAGSPGNCHGAAGDPGAGFSNFTCPPGDSMGCWMGMSTVLVSGQPADTTILLGVLRQTVTTTDFCTQGACMPKTPQSIVFGPDDVARISSWVNAGATND